MKPPVGFERFRPWSAALRQGGAGPAWTPADLGAKLLAWYDPSDLSTLFQNSDGTGAVTADGDPVGYVADKSGNGYHWTQATTTKRFTYRTDGTYHWLELDRVDDQMVATFPSSKSGTFIQAYTGGVLSGELTTGTTWTHPTVATRTPVSGIGQLILCDGVLTSGEKSLAVEYSKAFASSDNFAGATVWQSWWAFRSDVTEYDYSEIDSSLVGNMIATWQNNTGLPSFPVVDASGCNQLGSTWFGCSGLADFPLLVFKSAGKDFGSTWYGCGFTSFPAIDLSGGTRFSSAWQANPALADFPANMFDGATATNYTNAFEGTALTQTSIDNILVSINASGTSAGTFTQSGGSAPSATGEAAITALRGRGWTVTVTGGY